jgi:hypothetical protein
MGVVLSDITDSLGGEPGGELDTRESLPDEGAYYRVTSPGSGDPANPSSNSWDLAWYGRYVYLFDMNRGIEVLKLESGADDRAVGRLRSVAAPSVRRDRFASVPVGSLERGALVCPEFKDSSAARAAKRARRG